ncbi:hypothetical protein OSB04_022989 [Centaurea solstitialis]|uniref:Uncharacterized protein n=1 Tax=Centaurea solstitialis TaxID=347529 RepID=A0AA38T1T6_9ASTR|nr:hypothetical protein OSB04_022989 [Centaurea solstitialis]
MTVDSSTKAVASSHSHRIQTALNRQVLTVDNHNTAGFTYPAASEHTAAALAALLLTSRPSRPTAGYATLWPASLLYRQHLYNPGTASTVRYSAPVDVVFFISTNGAPKMFNSMSLNDPGVGGWFMDTGATDHVHADTGILKTTLDKHDIPPHVFDRMHIPTGERKERDLLSCIRSFTRHNKVSIEFDEFGFTVKDYRTRRPLIRCDSEGPLYPVVPPAPQVLVSSSHSVWHQRLGQLGDSVLQHLISSDFISCNNEKSHVVCHSCQQGKCIRLPFSISNTIVSSPFDIVHSDLWTSPTLSAIRLTIGFRCLDLATRKIIISRHVTFDESTFPYVSVTPTDPPSYTFLDDTSNEPSSTFRHILETPSPSSSLPSRSSATDIDTQSPSTSAPNMKNCNPSRTPAEPVHKLDSGGPPIADPSLYRSLAGALQYLTFTRPDIAFAVQQICLYMHDPREPHFHALKCILRYISGTIDHDLQIHISSPSSLVAYSDADWGGCPATRRSTSGYCLSLGDNLISWLSKRQGVISRSSAEAEYRGVANAVNETCSVRNLLRELHHPPSKATIVYCDNITAVYMSSNRCSSNAPNTLRSTFTLSGQSRIGHHSSSSCSIELSVRRHLHEGPFHLLV